MRPPLRCPECVDAGQRSKVYDLGGMVTAMGWSPFYDEDGDYHSHDPNTHTNSYQCSNGHSFTTTTTRSCPNEACDYGRTPTVAAAAATAPPNGAYAQPANPPNSPASHRRNR